MCQDPQYRNKYIQYTYIYVQYYTSILMTKKSQGTGDLPRVWGGGEVRVDGGGRKGESIREV